MNKLDDMTFSYDAAYAAMCMWEEIASPVLNDAGEPWQEMREQIGSAELRSRVFTYLGKACDEAWTRTYRNYQVEWNVWNVRRQEEEVAGRPFFDEEPREPGCFDYEFVPFWMRNCVDWSDAHTGPRVKGSGT